MHPLTAASTRHGYRHSCSCPNLVHWQVAVPETYAVFKGRLLDLIYDRAVQIQPAAALQASSAAAAV